MVDGRGGVFEWPPEARAEGGRKNGARLQTRDYGCMDGEVMVMAMDREFLNLTSRWTWPSRWNFFFFVFFAVAVVEQSRAWEADDSASLYDSS